MQKIKTLISKMLVMLCLTLAILPVAAPNQHNPFVTTVEAAYNKATIKAVQQALNDAGYNCGTPDGIAGKGTKAAIKDYQEAKGLTVTRTVNKTLLNSLDVKGTKSSSTSDNAATKDRTVYITETGSKYHISGCRYLRQSKIEISLSNAKTSYDPCSVCKP